MKKPATTFLFLLLLCQRKLFLPIYFEMFFLGFSFLLTACSKKHFDSWPHKFWQKPRFCSFFFLGHKNGEKKTTSKFWRLLPGLCSFQLLFPPTATLKATMVDFLFLLSPKGSSINYVVDYVTTTVRGGYPLTTVIFFGRVLFSVGFGGVPPPITVVVT